MLWKEWEEDVRKENFDKKMSADAKWEWKKIEARKRKNLVTIESIKYIYARVLIVWVRKLL